VSHAPRAAVVLAAGMGTRLRDLFPDRPKGFVEIGGETLIDRSLRLLGERGVERTVIVAGHLGERYHALAKSRAGVEVVDNPAYATTGSMASLARALEVVDEDHLLLESDLFYEERALDALLARPERDVLLTSTPTGATDEVWVEAVDGRLSAMSKDAGELDHVTGELVGIVRVSAEVGRALGRAYAAFVAERGHGQMAYEMDALVRVARSHPIHVECVDGLLWGEVDYEHHYLRVRDEVYPAWRARVGGAAAAGT
jgi:2-aminoethylphosphonate-pyruvate transaminase